MNSIFMHEYIYKYGEWQICNAYDICISQIKANAILFRFIGI